ncbi:amidase [Tepidiforma sp.]|uniref:amidase n=1 Tax=Tepidiforma sp. TaxID=2682230 RepID=UPI002ADDA005|nr:amidase family protein [Tepidiforma sp.]
MDRWMPAWEIAERVRKGELRAREVTERALERIVELNPGLNAFIQVDAEGALRQAEAIDARVAGGEDPGLLAGVPIGVKDLEPVKGLLFTEGSRAFEGRIAQEDSVQVARLRAAGAVIVGKTNTPEFGYKGFTENRLWGPTRNPWNPERTPGGSSGGSSAAVAAGMVPLATAGDGGGSIRIPAAMTGCYGIKPTAHRIPRAGAHAPTWGYFSTLGPMARTVRDAARYLDAAAGPHPNDPEVLDGPTGVYEAAALGERPRLRRVAWSADLGYAVVDPEVARVARAAADRLAAAVGAELVEDGPGFGDTMDPWMAIAAAGDTRLVDDMTEEQRAKLEPGFLRFAEVGRRFTAVDVARALEDRHRVNRLMTAFFERYDLLLTPTTAATAFRAEGPPPSEIAGKPVGPAGFIPFTYPFNFLGLPAASLPAGLSSEGLPIGLQAVAPRFADTLLLAVSAAYEAASPWRYPGQEAAG